MSDRPTPGVRTQPAAAAAPRRGPGIVSYDPLSFLVGAGIGVIIPFGGNLFASELLALALLPLLVQKRWSIFADPWLKVLVLLGIGWLVQQVVTDLVLGQPPGETLKNWAKIAFLLINMLVLTMLFAGRPNRWLLFAGGFFFGYLVQVATGSSLVGTDLWKFGLGIPTALLLVAWTTRLRLSKGRRFLLAGGLVLIVASAVAGFRSLALLIWMAMTFTLAQQLLVGDRPRPGGSRRLLLVAALGLGIIGLAYWAYTEAALAGYLGEKQREKLLWQTQSEYGLLLGARMETIVSVEAVARSPIVGYGSNPYSSELARYYERLWANGTRWFDASFVARGEVGTHSFLFEAWVRAGVLGAVFWSVVLALAITTLVRAFSVPSCLTPLVYFVGFLLLWDIAFSPISPDRRLLAAYCIAVLVGANRWYRTQMPRRRQ